LCLELNAWPVRNSIRHMPSGPACIRRWYPTLHKHRDVHILTTEQSVISVTSRLIPPPATQPDATGVDIALCCCFKATALHQQVASGAPTGLAEHSEEVWAAWVFVTCNEVAVRYVPLFQPLLLWHCVEVRHNFCRVQNWHCCAERVAVASLQRPPVAALSNGGNVRHQPERREENQSASWVASQVTK
jgi:hypothetical protein